MPVSLQGSDLFIMPLFSSGCMCPVMVITEDRSPQIYPSEYPKLQACLPSHYVAATRPHDNGEDCHDQNSNSFPSLLT